LRVGRTLSSNVSGIAAQLTAMNGAAARALARWMPPATSSFPVPVAPWMSTVMGEAAAISMSRRTSRMQGEPLTMSATRSERGGVGSVGDHLQAQGTAFAGASWLPS
jgi:hypothetical protein